MSATPTLTNLFAFADGNAGHACALGSAPSVGNYDLLCVNSDTVVSTPSGFTLGTSSVNAQGSYFFYRKAVGGEATSVTITTSGNFNCQVSHSRWSGLNLVDAAGTTVTSVIGSNSNTSNAATTATLGGTGELVVVFSGDHSNGLGNQSAPVWSSGYTALTGPNIQSAGSAAVTGFVGYKDNAGTTAESPSVTWSGDACGDRDTLIMVFTETGGAAVNATLAGTLPAMTSALTGTVGKPTATLAGTLPAVTSALTGTVGKPSATLAGALPAMTSALTGTAGVPTATLAGVLPAMTSALTGTAPAPRIATLAGSLPGLVALVTGTAVQPAAAPAPVGSWYTLLAIQREAAQFYRDDNARWPVACPNDGEPLRQGPHGELYCPFDGYRP